jgi:hypothetical protein
LKLNPRRIFLVTVVTIVFASATTTACAQWTESAELTPAVSQTDDFFGTSLAVSGNTMVVGAPALNQPSNAAYVFTESNGLWTQVAQLTPSDISNGLYFGYSVAVSGNTIVVSSVPLCCTSFPAGAAYVFVKPPTGWTNMSETAKLTDSSSTFDGFGTSVAISGNTVAVGAPLVQVGSNHGQGAVYVFVRPARGWTSMTPTATLTASDGATTDELGESVALQGSTCVAGAGESVSNGGAGAAYVFVSPGSGWANENETAKLTASDASSEDNNARSVAISADESTIVTGAPGRQFRLGTPYGAAYIFTKPSAGWQTATQTSEVFPPGPSQAFGLSMAINGPGTIVVAGAPNTMIGTSQIAGTAYVFRKPATGWPSAPTANARLNPPSPQTSGFFGWSVAMRATTVAIGEYDADVNGNTAQGAVYVFDRK